MKSTTTRKNIPVSNLKPSPENVLIYNQRNPDHPDQRGLIESIRKSGVLSPLQVSRDWYIVSGHSRWAAAQHVGLTTVPVEILPIRRSDHSSDEWVKILREHNFGRTKTFDEMTREALVDVTDDMVLRAAQDSRAMRSGGTAEEITIKAECRKRHGISRDKRQLADAIKQALIDLGDDRPVSVRAIHYALLKVPMLMRNTGKHQTRYHNDLKSYGDVSDMVTRMRLVGEIPWGWIVDETRPILDWKTWQNAADFIAEKCRTLFDGYSRDLLQSQRVFYVVIAEKLTVKGFIEGVCSKYTIPLLIGRGNSSIDLRYQLSRLFEKSGKDSLHIFAVGDCDPDGDQIIASFLQSLRDEFGIDDITADRVAITHQQADELHLPRNLEAKESSSSYDTFIQQHGRRDAYELEAAPPGQLREWLDSAIRGRINLESYNAEVDRQNEEMRHILARKRAILDLLKHNAD